MPLSVSGGSWLWVGLLGNGTMGTFKTNSQGQKVGRGWRLGESVVRPGSGGGVDVGMWTLSGSSKPLSSCSKTNTQVQGCGTKWGRDRFGRYTWREASGRSDRGRKGLSLGSSSTLQIQPFSWLQGRKQNSPVHTPPTRFPPSVLQLTKPSSQSTAPPSTRILLAPIGDWRVMLRT